MCTACSSGEVQVSPIEDLIDDARALSEDFFGRQDLTGRVIYLKQKHAMLLESGMILTGEPFFPQDKPWVIVAAEDVRSILQVCLSVIENIEDKDVDEARSLCKRFTDILHIVNGQINKPINHKGDRNEVAYANILFSQANKES